MQTVYLTFTSDMEGTWTAGATLRDSRLGVGFFPFSCVRRYEILSCSLTRPTYRFRHVIYSPYARSASNLRTVHVLFRIEYAFRLNSRFSLNTASAQRKINIASMTENHSPQSLASATTLPLDYFQQRQAMNDYHDVDVGLGDTALLSKLVQIYPLVPRASVFVAAFCAAIFRITGQDDGAVGLSVIGLESCLLVPYKIDLDTTPSVLCYPS